MNPSDKPLRKISLLDKTQDLLRKSGLKARKKLGQNFLVDESSLDLILNTAGLTGTETVIEVGPGLGVLTEELCRAAGQVISVELDDNLVEALRQNLAACNNLHIMHHDILKVTPEEILTRAGLEPSSAYRVVANLPYYITSPVLRHFLEAGHKPDLMVVMVQKEVAGGIAAGPGKMSLLSLGIQFYGQPEIVAEVPAECFYPAPKVDSAIVKITPHLQPPVGISDTEDFFSFVKAGFSAARKQLGNSLANGLQADKQEMLGLLEAAGISPQRRAETLSLEEWAHLWKSYRERTS